MSRYDTVGERVRMLRRELGLTQAEMASGMGIGKSALCMIETGKAMLSDRNRNILISKYNVNPDWITSGDGDMYNCPPEDFVHVSRRSDSAVPLQRVPLYDVSATAGFVSIFTDPSSQIPEDYISIPGLPKCDGAVHVSGDSMYPILSNGDIILYRQTRDVSQIMWGEMYLVVMDLDGDEYAAVKYLRRSTRAGYAVLASHNPLYADREVPLSRIRAVALVKASISMRSIG